jgi:tryptophan-rich sensory protein
MRSWAAMRCGGSVRNFASPAPCHPSRYSCWSALHTLVGIAFYGILGVVRYRALQRGDARSARLALVVLTLNELWNVAFFGRRSTRNDFIGLVLFTVPLAALQRAVADDRTSTLVLAPYSAWVGYDLVWTYQLWRDNPGGAKEGCLRAWARMQRAPSR